MNIGLIDVDGKIANLALMKISAWHKAHGDNIKWFDPLFDKPDKVYASKIFTFTPDYGFWPDCEIIKGGTGYDIKSKLPPEIEETQPDYSIYPNCDYSIQFFSRGCIRKCPFCVVHDKEGIISPVKPMLPNPNGKYVMVLDNNFFANPEWRSAMEWLNAIKQPVDFSGIDARIITDEQCEILNGMKIHKAIRMAWDNPRENLDAIFTRIVKIIKPYKIMVYVLIGYWSTPEQDLYRVEALHLLGISPFVMPYSKNDKYQARFARWVNHKAIFKSCEFAYYHG